MDEQKTTLDEFLDFIDGLIKFLNAGLLFLMIVSIALQVLSRYVLETPFPWTEEVARFSMVWISFLGASSLIRDNENTSVTFVVEMLPERVQFVLGIICKLLMMILIAILLYLSVTQLPIFLNEKSPALMISMFIPKSSILFGSVMILLQLINVTLIEWKRRKS